MDVALSPLIRSSYTEASYTTPPLRHVLIIKSPNSLNTSLVYDPNEYDPRIRDFPNTSLVYHHTFVYERIQGSCVCSASSKRRAYGERQAASSSSSSSSKQQAASSKQQTASSKRQAASGKRQAASSHAPFVETGRSHCLAYARPRRGLGSREGAPSLEIPPWV